MSSMSRVKVSFARNEETIPLTEMNEEKKDNSDVDTEDMSTSAASSSRLSFRRRRKQERKQRRLQKQQQHHNMEELQPLQQKVVAAMPPLPPLAAEPINARSASPSKRLFSFRRRSRSSSSGRGGRKSGRGGLLSRSFSSGGEESGPSEAETATNSSPTSVLNPPEPIQQQQPLQQDEQLKDEEPPMRCGSFDDPVVQLFAERTTQRVRFALEGGEDEMGPQPATPPRPKDNAGGGGAESDAGGSVSSPRLSPRSKLSRFMRGALFGSNNNKEDKAAVDAEMQRELESVKHELVWASTETGLGGEMIKTSGVKSVTATFVENSQTRGQVMKLLNKARRAQYVHFRYEYAVKCYVKALNLLKESNYPDDHPVAVRTMESLNNAHHILKQYQNSAKITQMGIKHEDAGELVRALKMYTIAYRMRVELLGASRHPSLAVLLNMLGHVQMKRGELREAMSIYELALKDQHFEGDNNNSKKSNDKDNQNKSPHERHPRYPTAAALQQDADSNAGVQQGVHQPQQQPDDALPPPRNLLARSVTYRDMGMIHEKWGDPESALKMYHKSLDFLAEYKGLDERTPLAVDIPNVNDHDDEVRSTSSVGMGGAPSEAAMTTTATATANATGGDDGMEVLMGRHEPSHPASPPHGAAAAAKNNNTTNSKVRTTFQASSDYDKFFPPVLDDWIRQQQQEQKRRHQQRQKSKMAHNGKASSKKGSDHFEPTLYQEGDMHNPPPADHADMDAALTLHQIGQLHRRTGEYNLALTAFSVSLRGIKYCAGRNHPLTAACLGNIGNLQKEMGDMDASFATYQQVLGIESYRLGLSHPDVAVTLHNIATIDAARGNHEHALALYRQVIALQRKLFGVNHVAVAVTSACMGDVYERVGDIGESIACFEEAVRIKTICMGRHTLEVARLLHKLGKLALASGEYQTADSYVSRSLLIYRLNKLSEQDEWMVDASRDAADVDAAIALGLYDARDAYHNHHSHPGNSSYAGDYSSSGGGPSYDQDSYETD